MAEIGAVATQEVGSNLELPLNRTLVVLPPIEVGPVYRREGVELRLGMHTDSVVILLRALSDIPDKDQLKIEGRVLSEEQEEALEASPDYQFYMQSRFDRTGLTVPKSLNLAPKKVALLAQARFSPSSLAGRIRYRTGYFNAGELVRRWLNGGMMVNELLPIIGGVNEFQIGSDTLSQERIKEISRILYQAFKVQESSVSSLQSANSQVKIPIGYASFSFPSLKPLLIFNSLREEELLNKKNPSINENIIPKEDLFGILKKQY